MYNFILRRELSQALKYKPNYVDILTEGLFNVIFKSLSPQFSLKST